MIRSVRTAEPARKAFGTSKLDITDGMSVMPQTRTYHVTVKQNFRKPLFDLKARRLAQNPSTEQLSTGDIGSDVASDDEATAAAATVARAASRDRSLRRFELDRLFPALVDSHRGSSAPPIAELEDTSEQKNSTSTLTKLTFSKARKQKQQVHDLQDLSRSTFASGSSSSLRPPWLISNSADALDLISDRKPAFFAPFNDALVAAEREEQAQRKARCIGPSLIPASSAVEMDEERQEMDEYITTLRERGQGINANLQARYEKKRARYQERRATRGALSNFEKSLREKERAQEKKRASAQQKEASAAQKGPDLFGSMASAFSGLKLF